MTDKKDVFYKQFALLSVLMTVPIVLLAGPAVGFVIGGWVDRKIRLYPWFTIIFIFLGFAASAREITRLLKQVSRNEES